MSNKVWNVPNVMTFIRLALVPVTVWLILEGHMMWALASFLIACATDLLDGYIARKYNQTTKLGIWLDPLADKLMAVAVIVTFTICPEHIFPPVVMIVVFVKEFLMLLGGLIILGRGSVTPSNKFGKAAAFLLNTCIASGFLYEYLAPYYLWATYLALVLVVVAFIQYAALNAHLIFEKKGEEKEE